MILSGNPVPLRSWDRHSPTRYSNCWTGRDDVSLKKPVRPASLASFSHPSSRLSRTTKSHWIRVRFRRTANVAELCIGLVSPRVAFWQLFFGDYYNFFDVFSSKRREAKERRGWRDWVGELKRSPQTTLFSAPSRSTSWWSVCPISFFLSRISPFHPSPLQSPISSYPVDSRYTHIALLDVRHLSFIFFTISIQYRIHTSR